MGLGHIGTVDREIMEETASKKQKKLEEIYKEVEVLIVSSWPYVNRNSPKGTSLVCKTRLKNLTKLVDEYKELSRKL